MLRLAPVGGWTCPTRLKIQTSHACDDGAEGARRTTTNASFFCGGVTEMRNLFSSNERLTPGARPYS
jgi:hypothetical protein